MSKGIDSALKLKYVMLTYRGYLKRRTKMKMQKSAFGLKSSAYLTRDRVINIERKNSKIKSLEYIRGDFAIFGRRVSPAFSCCEIVIPKTVQQMMYNVEKQKESGKMKSTDPLFPYQNIFITARHGMGATKKERGYLQKIQVSSLYNFAYLSSF